MAIPLVVYWQRQAILDWWRLRGYNPPPAISSLTTDTQMTDQAKHIFYVNRPQLIDKVEDFRAQCTISEKTIVLGCYQPIQQGVYVYSVKDERLSGIAQVTAAHEMLHAAYDRLSVKDKAYINAQIEDYYKNQLNDERIKKNINLYKQTEPDELINEMHSIFATEIASLPQPLETYYQRYFKDRQAVVGFSTRYEGEFSGRRDKLDALNAQLNDLKPILNSRIAELNALGAQIDEESRRLDSLKSNGQTAEYNAGVPAFNAMVERYRPLFSQYKRVENQFNSIVNEFNNLKGELDVLFEAIDTRTEAVQPR